MTGAYPLMIRRQRQLGLDLLTIEEVAGRCGLHPEFIQRLVVLGLIDPAEDCGDLFRPEVTSRIERLLRLRRDLGVNYSAAALVLDLLERIDLLEERLRRLGCA
jgi:DNA-binding transcriptional MerR regulator